MSVFRSFSRHLSLSWRICCGSAFKLLLDCDDGSWNCKTGKMSLGRGRSLVSLTLPFCLLFPTSLISLHQSLCFTAVRFMLGGDTGSFSLSLLCLHVWPSCQETHKHKRSRRWGKHGEHRGPAQGFHLSTMEKEQAGKCARKTKTWNVAKEK